MRSVRILTTSAVALVLLVAGAIHVAVRAVGQTPLPPPIVGDSVEWGAAALYQSCGSSSWQYGEEHTCSALFNGPLVRPRAGGGTYHPSAGQGGFGVFGAACNVTFALNGNYLRLYAYDNNTSELFGSNPFTRTNDTVTAYVPPGARITVEGYEATTTGPVSIKRMDNCAYSNSGYWVPSRYLLVNPMAAKAKQSLVCANYSPSTYINVWYTCDRWGQVAINAAGNGQWTIDLPFQGNRRFVTHYALTDSFVTGNPVVGPVIPAQRWTVLTDASTGLMRFVNLDQPQAQCLTLPADWAAGVPNLTMAPCTFADADRQQWTLVAIPWANS